VKRPSFQFYPADWKNNSKLRRCSEAARGAWVDILCLLHDSDEYGVCRWPLDELARAAGIPLKLAKELAAKDVLKGADKAAKPYVFVPRHAGKDGDPVVLVSAEEGPCWYCSRFVRDEWIRLKRGQATQFSADSQPPKPPPKAEPKPTIGERQGDGPTSTSTSTSTLKAKSKTIEAPATRLPQDWKPSPADIAFCETERPDLKPHSVAAQFRDYWIALPPNKGKKSDWAATWRNWVRNQRVQPARSPPYQTQQEKTKELADRLTGKRRNDPDIIDITPSDPLKLG
jgi:hypothetical protein